MSTSSETSSSAKVIRCANCDRKNPSDRKFCGECGGRLWESCIKCQVTNAVDEKFCGSCGANLAEVLQQRIDELDKQLETAIRLEREGKFYDATVVLRQVSGNGDPRLEAFQTNAIKLLEQLEKRKTQRTSEAEHFEVVAQEHYDLKRFDLAFEAINAIPEGLRTREIAELYQKIETRHREVRELYAEIRSDLKAKRTEGLLEKVARYCELQPHHKEASQLAKKLEKQQRVSLAGQAKQLAVLAQKKMKAGEFREAAEAAEKIAPNFRTGKIEQVYRQAREGFWLQRQLQVSPVADETLLKIARRWQRFKPDDHRAAEHIQALTERLKEKPKDRRFGMRSWAQSNLSDRFAIKPWTHIAKALPADDEVAAILSDSPGQFFVAYGLALQALGVGRFQHDLNPGKNNWSRFLSKRKHDRVWGIDIGSTSIKALELSKQAKDESLEISNAVRIELAKPDFELQNEEERAEALSEAIQELLEFTGKKPTVALGLPGHLTLPRFFDLPPIKSKKTSMDETVRFEMQHQIPLPLDEAVYDYYAWDMSGASFAQRQSITAIAARKDDVENWMRPLSEAGCDVVLLQCDAFALYNSLHHEILQGKDSEYAVALLDVGGDLTNIVVAENGFIWTRSIFFGTKRFENSIVRELKLTTPQANEVRIDPTRVKWVHRLMEALEPDFQELVEDFERSIRGYPKKTTLPVQLLLGVGGGFRQYGLLQAFVNPPKNESSK